MGRCTRRRSYAPGVSSKRRMSSGVSTGPGQSALTRTPCRANWTASSRLSARTAPFEAVYAICDAAALEQARDSVPAAEIDAPGVDRLHAVPGIRLGDKDRVVVGGHDSGVVV